MIKTIEETLTHLLAVIIGCIIVLFFDLIGKPIPVFPLLLAIILVCNIGAGFEIAKCLAVALITSAVSAYWVYSAGMMYMEEMRTAEISRLASGGLICAATGWFYARRRTKRCRGQRFLMGANSTSIVRARSARIRILTQSVGTRTIYPEWNVNP